MLTRIALAVLAAWWMTTSSACSSGGPGSADTDGGRTDSLDLACTASIPKAQPPTAECCPAWGIDACGGGLFCAAFDGRSVAVCYLEHSRTGGQECFDDLHCVTASCNTAVGKCRVSPGERCSEEIGCAPSGGSTYGCSGGVCVKTMCSVCGELACCDGVCTDAAIDTFNCGTCGNACTEASAPGCVEGQCGCLSNGGAACPSGSSCCTNGCKNLLNDGLNCGYCGQRCSVAQQCVNGQCGGPP
jgi:hypothetical protein